MNKIYIVHSDWYDVCWYEDPVCYIYQHLENAKAKVEEIKKEFEEDNDVKMNKREDWYRYENKEEDVVFDLWISSENVLDYNAN